MSNEAKITSALTAIGVIQRRSVELLRAVDRKRNWRPSEKAMAKAKYMIEIEALDLCKKLLEAEHDKKSADKLPPNEM